MNERTLDELFYHMPRLAETAPSEWERSFAGDMAKRGRWRNWKPSKKQIEIMHRMVRQMFAEGETFEVIER